MECASIPTVQLGSMILARILAPTAQSIIAAIALILLLAAIAYQDIFQFI
jgi:hypothetical protein